MASKYINVSFVDATGSKHSVYVWLEQHRIKKMGTGPPNLWRMTCASELGTTFSGMFRNLGGSFFPLDKRWYFPIVAGDRIVKLLTDINDGQVTVSSKGEESPSTPMNVSLPSKVTPIAISTAPNPIQQAINTILAAVPVPSEGMIQRDANSIWCSGPTSFVDTYLAIPSVSSSYTLRQDIRINDKRLVHLVSVGDPQ